MSETDTDDNVVPHARVRSLREAVQKARLAETARDDAVEERRETEATRLDLLLDDLKPIIADIPADDDRFDFAISRGTTPRLWIDATTHVVIARDARTYRLLSDTRLGRVVLAETDDVEQVSDRITAHVAERMIERERAIEGDWRVARMNERAAEDAASAAEARQRARTEAENPAKPARGDSGGGLLGLFLGLVIGAAVLAIYLHYTGAVDMLKLLNLPMGTQVEDSGNNSAAPTAGKTEAAPADDAAPKATAPEAAKPEAPAPETPKTDDGGSEAGKPETNAAPYVNAPVGQNNT